MKILRLSWQNIHSLRCKAPESIDLEAAPFLGNGLFTITGPTGAGKSTLLDVICLALYGRTPRFGDSASPAEHVMSWGTGECMAEVDYEIRGQRFRSRWQCHRARRKPEGSLQSPSMQVLRIDVSPEQTLHTLSRDVLLFNETQVGLKFEHFRRAILLAQGQFADFLKGKGENRRDILERLTDTRIYVELSRAVYRRADALAQGLAELRRQKAEALGRVLPPEALAELESGIAQVVATLAALGEARTALALERHRLDELDRLDREAEGALADAVALDAQLAERSPDWAALSRHDALAPLAEVLANHARDTAAQAQLRAEIEAGVGRRPALAAAVETAEAGVAERTTAREALREKRTALAPVWDAAQALDEQLETHRVTFRKLQADLGTVRAEAAGAETECGQVQSALAESTARRAAAQVWLTENAGDAALPERLSGLVVERQNAEAALAEIEQAARAQAASAQRATEARAAAARAEGLRVERAAEHKASLTAERASAEARDLVAAGESLDTLASQQAAVVERLAENDRARTTGEARAACRRALAALAVEATEIETALAATATARTGAASLVEARRTTVGALRAKHRLEVQVRSLSEHRATLVDGVPCPLCGALEHPLAGQATPDADATEREIAAAEGTLAEAQRGLDTLVVAQARDEARRAGLAARVEEQRARFPAGPDAASPEAFDAEGWPAAATALASHRVELQVTQAALAERLPRLRAAQAAWEKAAQRARETERAALEAERAAQPAAEATREAEAAGQRADEALAKARTEADTRLNALDAALTRAGETSAPGSPTATGGPTSPSGPTSPGSLTAPGSPTSQTGLTAPPDDEHAPARRLEAARRRLDALRGRAEAWKRTQDDLAAATHRVTELSGRLATAEKARELSRRRVAEVERELETLTETAQDLAGQRAEVLPADRKPAEERRRMEAELLRADEAVEAAQLTLATAQQAVSTLDHLQADRGARRESLEAALRQAEATCAGHPAAEGKTIATLRAERLPDAHAQALRAEQTALNTRNAAARARHADRLADRERVASTRQTELSREALVERDAALAETAAQTQAQLDERHLARSRHRAAEDTVRACDAAMGERGVVAARWDKLNTLIGSADGKKFATFAQTLNLRHLLRRGNEHLARISGRYRMAAGEELRIEIEDTWQNGDRRSVDGLSGGETFMVSLALALGLADMASRDVRIDSLFIDEGFGTLDADVLEDVISALESQVFSGKLVGIISHVDGLKERIPLGVRVRPLGDGQSRVDVES